MQVNIHNLEPVISDYTILPLIGLQEKDRLWLEGHIVRINTRFLMVRNREKYWRNIARVVTSYLPGAIKRRRLEIHFKGRKFEAFTNKYGLIKLSLPLKNDARIDQKDFEFFLYRNKTKIKIHLPEPFMYCFYRHEEDSISVISDIDDTVLVTHTRNPVKKLRTLLIKNAYKRKAVKEIRDLYRYFAQRGYSFFYISNSEANLFPMIRLFLEHQGLPLGPIFLKSFKKWKTLFKRKKTGTGADHKHEKIRLLLEIFPDMKFILIGDDSQQDPEIYTSIAENYPDRIRKIFIRQVNVKKRREKRVLKKEGLLKEKGIPVIYFETPNELLPVHE